MNPDTSTPNHLNLPPPVGERQPNAPLDGGGGAFTPENLPVTTPEAAGNRPAAVPSLPSAQDDVQQALQPTNPVAQQVAAITTTPTQTSVTNDVLVDKEWVLKAKQIVNQTVDDPFEQNRQLAKVKADYLQKRYGKVVKLTE